MKHFFFFFTLFKIENAFLFIAKKIILQSKQYEAQKLKFIFNIIVCVYISHTHTKKKNQHPNISEVSV